MKRLTDSGKTGQSLFDRFDDDKPQPTLSVSDDGISGKDLDFLSYSAREATGKPRLAI